MDNPKHEGLGTGLKYDLWELPKCWLCGSSDPVPQVHYEVSAKSPGGARCKPHQVLVHFGCVQDMDQ